MIPLWAWVSIAAALAQALRFMLQKQLTDLGLSAPGATFARFAFAAPVMAVSVPLYAMGTAQAVPSPDLSFWIFAGLGGAAQILGTICTIVLFRRRNFAVGVSLAKTEVLLASATGFLILGDKLSGMALLAILLGVVGVLFLSKPGERGGAIAPVMALGLGAGALFAISGVSYRGASLSLSSGDALLRAAMTLAIVTSLQTMMMIAGFLAHDRRQIARVLHQWRRVGLVALLSMLGSLGWFTAFTLQNVALVKAVGKVELIFGLLISGLIFREKLHMREGTGIALIAVSVIALILLGG